MTVNFCVYNKKTVRVIFLGHESIQAKQKKLLSCGCVDHYVRHVVVMDRSICQEEFITGLMNRKLVKELNKTVLSRHIPHVLGFKSIHTSKQKS